MRRKGAEASEQFSRDCGSTMIAPKGPSSKSQLSFFPGYREYIVLGKVIAESLNLHSAACTYQKAPSKSLSEHLWVHSPIVKFLSQCLITIWAAGGEH